MRAEGGEVLLGPLTEKAMKEYKEKVKQRKDLIKRIWKLFDIVDEQGILERMEEMEKQLEKEGES